MRSRSSLHAEIDLLTSNEQVSPFSKHVLIFYIPGNPGLIEYYRNYLRYLTKDLNQDAPHSHRVQYHLHGESLAGFGKSTPRTPYSLDEIKDHLVERMEEKSKEVTTSYDLKGALPVILIGHSIGAWLALEAIARAQQDGKANMQTAHIVGGILLFPTVVDIAKSPNALRASWLLRLPHPDLVVATIARLLFLLVPLFLLTGLLQLLLRMSHHSALVTATFLKTPGQVRQALYMARGEFLQVTDDNWSSQLWGVPDITLTTKEAKALAKDASGASAKLYFYWGQNDHWVANTTRDAVIAQRAQTSERPSQPWMEIDDQGLPHAFAVRDRGAQIVADKTAGWIREIVQAIH